MNEVDYLTSVRFSTLPIEQKLEIKRLGPQEVILIGESNTLTDFYSGSVVDFVSCATGAYT